MARVFVSGSSTGLGLLAGDSRFSCLTGQCLHHMATREPSKVNPGGRLQNRLLDLCRKLTGILL